MAADDAPVHLTVELRSKPNCVLRSPSDVALQSSNGRRRTAMTCAPLEALVYSSSVTVSQFSPQSSLRMSEIWLRARP